MCRRIQNCHNACQNKVMSDVPKFLFAQLLETKTKKQFIIEGKPKGLCLVKNQLFTRSHVATTFRQVIPSYQHTIIIPSYQHTIVHHSIISAHHHTIIIPPYQHTIILSSYHHTSIPAYQHIIRFLGS